MWVTVGLKSKAPDSGGWKTGNTGGVQPWVRAVSFTSSSSFLRAPRSSCLESSEGPWTCSRAGPESRRSAPGLPLSRNIDQLEWTLQASALPGKFRLRDKLPGFHTVPLPAVLGGRFCNLPSRLCNLTFLICKVGSVIVYFIL